MAAAAVPAAAAFCDYSLTAACRIGVTMNCSTLQSCSSIGEVIAAV
jgi:hypothetical protein